MDSNETIKILSVIKAAYPQWARELTQSDAKAMVALWSSMLIDHKYNIVQLAIKKIIATNKFPPSIAEVLEAVNFITSKGKSEMTEIEAWGLVRKAINNSAYNAEEEFNKLPLNIQEAIGSHNILRNWSQENVEGLEKVIGSNFMRSYKAATLRQKEFEKIPSDIKNLLQNANMKMLGGNEVEHCRDNKLDDR